MDGDARNVARDVGEALEALVPDELLGHDGDRLRNVDQRRVGLGRDRRAVGVDADRAGAGILRVERRGWAGPPARGAGSGTRAGRAFFWRHLDFRPLAAGFAPRGGCGPRGAAGRSAWCWPRFRLLRRILRRCIRVTRHLTETETGNLRYDFEHLRPTSQFKHLEQLMCSSCMYFGSIAQTSEQSING